LPGGGLLQRQLHHGQTTEVLGCTFGPGTRTLEPVDPKVSVRSSGRRTTVRR